MQIVVKLIHIYVFLFLLEINKDHIPAFPLTFHLLYFHELSYFNCCQGTQGFAKPFKLRTQIRLPHRAKIDKI